MIMSHPLDQTSTLIKKIGGNIVIHAKLRMFEQKWTNQSKRITIIQYQSPEMHASSQPLRWKYDNTCKIGHIIIKKKPRIDRYWKSCVLIYSKGKRKIL